MGETEKVWKVIPIIIELRARYNYFDPSEQFKYNAYSTALQILRFHTEKTVSQHPDITISTYDIGLSLTVLECDKLKFSKSSLTYKALSFTIGRLKIYRTML